MRGVLTGTVRRFRSLGEYAAFLNEQVAVAVPVTKLALGATANVLYSDVRREYGQHELPALAKSTQDERARLGYTPDDPLKRTGELLRDSVEMEVGENWASAGTSEPIAAYHEFGYFNVRAQKMVVPRQAFRLAFEKSLKKVAAIVSDLSGVILGFKTVSFGDIASRSNTYLADAEDLTP